MCWYFIYTFLVYFPSFLFFKFFFQFHLVIIQCNVSFRWFNTSIQDLVLSIILGLGLCPARLTSMACISKHSASGFWLYLTNKWFRRQEDSMRRAFNFLTSSSWATLVSTKGYSSCQAVLSYTCVHWVTGITPSSSHHRANGGKRSSLLQAPSSLPILLGYP